MVGGGQVSRHWPCNGGGWVMDRPAGLLGATYEKRIARGHRTITSAFGASLIAFIVAKSAGAILWSNWWILALLGATLLARILLPTICAVRINLER